MIDDLALGPNGLPLPNLGDPKFVGERVYVVTLKDWNDNDSLYNDMENNGGPLNIPQRVVTCTDRRPEERNTDYLLTYEEAVALSKDPRVAAIELNIEDLGVVITRHGWESVSTFTKAFALAGTDIDWGLYRTLSKTNTVGWGQGGSQTLPVTTLLSDASGKNVDVVIVDGGLPYPVTLEYAQNSDGTGYPRMVQYDWSGAGYSYAALSNGHQAHTSGTAAGNSQGHARDANIYNLTYNNPFTYVKNFHLNKPVNPLTGVKNPTITNNSWGYSGGISSYSTLKLNTSRVRYRGVDYYPTSGTAGSYVWSDATLQACGIPTLFGNGWPARNASTDANFIDAAKAGVINVCSAGNSFFYTAKPSSDPNNDYNNYLVYIGSVYYYHRGSSPGSADEVVTGNYSLDYSPICVGAMGAVVTGTMSASTINMLYGTTSTSGLLQLDYKSEFSNYGTRVDVFAPGENTLSVINSTAYTSGVVPDPRAAALGITDGYSVFARDAGTSMSAPHVCGVLACILEKYPRMTPPEVRQWVSFISPSTMASTTGGAKDATDAGFLSWSTSSNKQIIYQKGTRVKEAEVGGFREIAYPTVDANYRRTTGQVWPRTQSLVSYNNNATIELSASTTASITNGVVNINLTTSNISDGTVVPYIIAARMKPSNTLADNGVSGIYTTSAAMTGSITGFSSAPNTGNRIVTSGGGVGTRTSISNSLLGAASLTVSTTPTTGNSDDGYWAIGIPFNITFNGTSYSTLYIGTNFYITFGGGSTAYTGLSATSPAFNKIMISADDNSVQRIYSGVEGTSPNRTFRVRVEGHNAPTGGTLGSPDMLYEAVFYENTPAQIDIHTGVNSQWAAAGSTYNFTRTAISNAPLTGNFTVQNNTATLSLTMSGASSYIMYVRTNTFPTAVTTFTHN
jgi:hypothetical protein